MPDDTYTHGHHASVLRSHTWRTVENSAAHLVPHLRSGMTVLDVGCGPGTITADLARLVAPGTVVGIDRSDDVVALAAESVGDVDGLLFTTGDVYALDAADGAFDVVHAHQVLQHLSDPVAALREIRRACRPDGVVAVRDSDYGAFRVRVVPEERAWWGGLWADRTREWALAEQAVERGLSTPEELEVIAEAFRAWAQAPDGWFAVLHGEVIARP